MDPPFVGRYGHPRSRTAPLAVLQGLEAPSPRKNWGRSLFEDWRGFALAYVVRKRCVPGVELPSSFTIFSLVYGRTVAPQLVSEVHNLWSYGMVINSSLRLIRTESTQVAYE